MASLDQRSAWRRGASRRGVLRGALVGSAGLAAFTLACGGSGDSKSGSGGSTSSQSGGAPGAASTSAVAAAQPKRGGTIQMYTTDNKRGFDPMAPQAWAAADNFQLLSAYSNLLMFKSGPGSDPNKREIDGDLITKWEQVDPTTVKLSINPDAAFHEVAPINGRKVTSEDVKFSVERMKASSFAYKGSYLNFDRVETPDPQTAVIRLSKPDADGLENLAHWYLKILPKEGGVAKADGLLGRDFLPPNTIVGSGPWVFKEYVPDDRMSFTRNPKYFKKGLPYPDELVINLLPSDPAATQAAILSKKIFLHDQITGQIGRDMDAAEEYAKSGMKRIDAQDVPFHNDHTTFNITYKPLDDIRVRRAMIQAFDSVELYGGLLKFDTSRKTMKPAVGQLSQAHGEWYWGPEKYKADVAQWYKTDVAKANALLDGAGFPKGANGLRPIELSLQYSQIYNEPDMQATAGYLRQRLGVNIKLDPMEHAKALTTLHAGNFPVMGSVGEKSGPSINQQFELYRASGIFKAISGTVEDPRLLEMFDKQFGETNKEARLKLVQAMQEYAAEQAWELPRMEYGVAVVWWADKVENAFTKDRHHEYWSLVK